MSTPLKPKRRAAKSEPNTTKRATSRLLLRPDVKRTGHVQTLITSHFSPSSQSQTQSQADSQSVLSRNLLQVNENTEQESPSHSQTSFASLFASPMKREEVTIDLSDSDDSDVDLRGPVVTYKPTPTKFDVFTSPKKPKQRIDTDYTRSSRVLFESEGEKVAMFDEEEEEEEHVPAIGANEAESEIENESDDGKDEEYALDGLAHLFKQAEEEENPMPMPDTKFDEMDMDEEIGEEKYKGLSLLSTSVFDDRLQDMPHGKRWVPPFESNYRHCNNELEIILRRDVNGDDSDAAYAMMLQALDGGWLESMYSSDLVPHYISKWLFSLVSLHSSPKIVSSAFGVFHSLVRQHKDPDIARPAPGTGSMIRDIRHPTTPVSFLSLSQGRGRERRVRFRSSVPTSTAASESARKSKSKSTSASTRKRLQFDIEGEGEGASEGEGVGEGRPQSAPVQVKKRKLEAEEAEKAETNTKSTPTLETYIDTDIDIVQRIAVIAQQMFAYSWLWSSVLLARVSMIGMGMGNTTRMAVDVIPIDTDTETDTDTLSSFWVPKSTDFRKTLSLYGKRRRGRNRSEEEGEKEKEKEDDVSALTPLPHNMGHFLELMSLCVELKRSAYRADDILEMIDMSIECYFDGRCYRQAGPSLEQFINSLFWYLGNSSELSGVNARIQLNKIVPLDEYSTWCLIIQRLMPPTSSMRQAIAVEVLNKAATAWGWGWGKGNEHEPDRNAHLPGAGAGPGREKSEENQDHDLPLVMAVDTATSAATESVVDADADASYIEMVNDVTKVIHGACERLDKLHGGMRAQCMLMGRRIGVLVQLISPAASVLRRCSKKELKSMRSEDAVELHDCLDSLWKSLQRLEMNLKTLGFTLHKNAVMVDENRVEEALKRTKEYHYL